MSSRAWHLVQGLTVAAVLVLAALPVESALQLAQPLPETEKAASCTVPGPSPGRVTRDQDKPLPDGPRVAAGKRAPEGHQEPRPDPAHPEVCPLHLEQQPGPPRARP